MKIVQTDYRSLPPLLPQHMTDSKKKVFKPQMLFPTHIHLPLNSYPGNLFQKKPR